MALTLTGLPSRLKTATSANCGPLLKRQHGLIRRHDFGWKTFWEKPELSLEPFGPGAPGFEALFPAYNFRSTLSASDWTPDRERERERERVDGWGRGMS